MLKRPLCARRSRSSLRCHSDARRWSDQSRAMLDERILAHRLGENIRHHVLGIDVGDRYTALVALLADELT